LLPVGKGEEMKFGYINLNSLKTRFFLKNPLFSSSNAAYNKKFTGVY
jgi:hypothetical protein